MCIHIYLTSVKTPFQEHDKWCLKWKKRLCVLFITIFAVAIVLYFWHNTYCTPLVYSFYGLAEWVVVFTNSAFNYLVLFEFPYDVHIYLGDKKNIRHTF